MRCSALPLATKCRGSYHLTQGYGSELSRIGTAFHEAARAKVLGVPFDMESLRTRYGLTDDEMKSINYGIYNITIAIPEGAHVMADDKQITGLDGKLTGTPDLGIYHKYVLTIADFKSGWGDIEDPETNNQLIGYAILILEELIKRGTIEKWEDVKYVNLIVVQPKLNQVKTFSLTPAQLRARADDIRRIIKEAEEGAHDYTTGPWCTGCFKSMNCPAFAGQMKTLAKFVEPTLETCPHDIEQSLRVLLPFAKSVKTMGAKIEDLAKAWVDKNGPLDLGGGQIYARVLDNEKEVDAQKTFDALKEYFAEDRIWEVFSASITKINALAVETKRGLSTIVMNRLLELEAIEPKSVITYRIIKGGNKDGAGK